MLPIFINHLQEDCSENHQFGRLFSQVFSLWFCKFQHDFWIFRIFHFPLSCKLPGSYLLHTKIVISSKIEKVLVWLWFGNVRRHSFVVFVVVVRSDGLLKASISKLELQRLRLFWLFLQLTVRLLLHPQILKVTPSIPWLFSCRYGHFSWILGRHRR